MNRTSLGIFVLAALIAACNAGSTSPPATAAAARGFQGEGLPGALGVGGSPSKGASLGFAVATEPPVSLTAGDGTGLRLASMKAQAIIDGPLAFTELKMEFENPNDRTLEGTFRIALPQNASLGRFAMKIDGNWQEGEVVELETARRAYEDFLHRKQDPALMEKAAGNEFSARVFPIPAKGIKEIVVAYVQEIEGPKYTLPLKGLPELGSLEIEAKVLGAKADPPKVALKNTTPGQDYALEVAANEKTTRATAVRSGDLAIVRVRPQTTSAPEPLDSVIVLVDTSASRVLGFDHEVDVVGRIARRIAEGKGAVSVACFDQTVTPVFEGRASEIGSVDLAKIKDRGALGASDLERALAWAEGAAKRSHAKRVVLVTDGVPTAGATDPKKLVPKVSALRSAGVERIDAVAVGGIRDDAGLRRMVRGNLAHDGVVADATHDVDDVIRRLGEATRSNIAVRVEGATWTWPAKLDGVQAGDAYSIYAEIPSSSKITVSIDGKTETVADPRKTERPLIERAVAQAKVTSMLEREALGKEPTLKKSITAIATKHRIMTPYTAMLVLETEQDYVQYGIDRKSLTDVLAIQDGNVRRVHRTDIVKLPLARPPAPRNKSDEGYGYEFADDPLAAGGFGPNDATIRVMPAPSAAGGAPSTGNRSTSPATPRPPAAEPAKPTMDAKAADVPFQRVRPGPVAAQPAPPPPPPPPPARRPREEARGNLHFDRDADGVLDADDSDDGPRREGRQPYEGKLATVMDQIKVKRFDEALRTAAAWHAEAPGDVLALIAIGEAAEAKGLNELAARAYGSIIDLFSNRADLRRFAGERLERLSMKDAAALDLAIDSFEKAAADRPDHPSSHRLLTFALLRKKSYARAFESALTGMKRPYEVDRFRGVDQILREDLGLVGAAWARAEPTKKEEILQRVRQAGGRVEDQPSLRFVLNWETDANDVDFHIHDAKGGHAFFSRPHLQSGGDLYADVTTGYGPECFTIRGAKNKRVGPYVLEAHYYSRGPMGYGMGKLEVIDHDGNGNIVFEERPFVVMVDSAFVDLGTVR